MSMPSKISIFTKQVTMMAVAASCIICPSFALGNKPTNSKVMQLRLTRRKREKGSTWHEGIWGKILYSFSGKKVGKFLLVLVLDCKKMLIWVFSDYKPHKPPGSQQLPDFSLQVSWAGGSGGCGSVKFKASAFFTPCRVVVRGEQFVKRNEVFEPRVSLFQPALSHPI